MTVDWKIIRLFFKRFLEKMKGKRVQTEGTRKDFVTVDRRVVFRIHKEEGPNVLEL